jgi:hypothetical protein
MTGLSKRPTPALVGVAGVHYVVSELSRRGLIALPTVRNVAAFDVVVSTRDGRKHANIQVKTSLRRVNFFPMPPSNRVSASPRIWYVLLRWLNAEDRFEGFMLSGRETREEVRRGERFQAKRMTAGTRRALFPSVYVGPKVGSRRDRWRRKWLKWNLWQIVGKLRPPLCPNSSPDSYKAWPEAPVLLLHVRA